MPAAQANSNALTSHCELPKVVVHLHRIPPQSQQQKIASCPLRVPRLRHSNRKPTPGFVKQLLHRSASF